MALKIHHANNINGLVLLIDYFLIFIINPSVCFGNFSTIHFNTSNWSDVGARLICARSFIACGLFNVRLEAPS